MSDTYQCYICKNTYEKDQTEEDAVKEMQENFTVAFEPYDCVLFCDDCYNELGLGA